MTYIYVTSERFGSDTAAAARILSFCKILTELNHNILVVSLDEAADDKGTFRIHHGIQYVSLRSTSATIFPKILNHLRFTSRLKTCLAKLNHKYNIEGIFFYNIPIWSVVFLKKYSLKKNMQLFHDSVEWYSPEQFKWGKFAFPYLCKNILNSRLIDTQVKVFSISSYLNEYYCSKHIKSARFPIMVDTALFSFKKKNNPRKNLIALCGLPWQKRLS